MVSELGKSAELSKMASQGQFKRTTVAGAHQINGIKSLTSTIPKANNR